MDGKFVIKMLVRHPNMDAPDRLLAHQAVENLAADVGKHLIGDHGVNHPRAAFKFRAAARDEFRYGVVIGHLNLMHLLHPVLDPGKLQMNDPTQHRGRNRIIGYHEKSIEQGIGEHLDERTAKPTSISYPA